MNKGIFITVACCMGFMALILALFLSRFYTPRELTQDEYKALGAYFVDPPRQLADFNLIDDRGNEFLPDQFEGKWNILFFWFYLLPRYMSFNHEAIIRCERSIVRKFK